MLAFYLTLVDEPEDKSLVEKIYYDYRDHMFAAANGILQNEQDAEDAVHDAFVKIAQNIKMFRKYDEDHLKASVLAITRHRALNMLKKGSNVEIDSLDDEKSEAFRSAHDTQDIEQDFIDKLRYERLNRAIENLAEGDRDLITLYYVQRLPGKDIAKMFDMKDCTVRKKAERLRKKLYEACGGDEYEK
ncbi:MAG: sigma-70 family RNA polymerase sigma factor [Clostridia bacterium]|nr:sigma-70 family RNA polymerase sigma factor [Clostridia bacterium]